MERYSVVRLIAVSATLSSMFLRKQIAFVTSGMQENH